jgi:outer membrane protein assembly factor BamB
LWPLYGLLSGRKIKKSDMDIRSKLKLSQDAALIAGIFCMVVALLLLLNYWQVSGNDPIESKALVALVERLKQDSNNAELIAEIRNYDLLARKAYFNSQWQVRTGAYMLLFGSIVLVIALTVYYTLKSKIEIPEKVLENEIKGRILAQKWLVVLGGVVFISAFAASFATENHLERYSVNAVLAEASAETVDEGIQIIEVGEAVSVEPAVSAAEEIISAEPAAAEPSKEEVVKETASPAEPRAVAALTAENMKEHHNSFRGPLGQGIIYHRNIPTQWDGPSGANILWKVAVPKHGYNSPVVWGDQIFVTGADNQGREVYSFSRADGKLLWTAKADNIQGSPSTLPRVTEDTGLAAPTVTTDGQRVFAIFATGDVMALDMSGKRLWARNLGVPDNHYGHSSSLITLENKLFVQYDTNKGGKVIALNVATGETIWETTRAAKISWASPVLAQVDGKYQLVLTADPIVAGYDIQTGKELWSVKCMMGEVGPSVGYTNGVVYAANEYAKMVAIDIKSQNILWEQDMYLPEAASPLAHNGLVVVATSYGVIACYDAKTGEQYWEHDVGKTIYSSPVFAEGKMYLMDNDGTMRIYEFGKEMKLIAENKLGEHAGTTPAFANGRIYIRSDKNLYCIGK